MNNCFYFYFLDKTTKIKIFNNCSWKLFLIIVELVLNLNEYF